MIKLSDLFEIKYGNGFELVSMNLCQDVSKDSVAFVSRTSKNNGISAMVEKLNDVEPFKAGLITVSVGGSVLETFLQEKPFYTGFHVLVLSPKSEMSEIEKLFYCFCIRQNKYRYNYGRQANKTLKDILIPKQMPAGWEKIKIEQINKLNEEPLISRKSNLLKSEWQYFDLVDLFEISASKDELINDLTEDGKTPYITSSDSNNGVTSYVEEDPTNPAGTITANRGGSVGYFYYQPISYKATPVDVRILSPKFKINRYIGLFVKTVLQLERYRFNYSRKMGSGRLAQFKIKLPSKDRYPDWKFMEDYIKSLPYSAEI